MYMMYYMDENNQRVYTMAKVDPVGNPTFSAHPARYPHNFVQKKGWGQANF